MDKKITWYKLGVPTELWHKFKIKCAVERKSMLSVIISSIKKFVGEK